MGESIFLHGYGLLGRFKRERGGAEGCMSHFCEHEKSREEYSGGNRKVMGMSVINHSEQLRNKKPTQGKEVGLEASESVTRII